MRIDFTAPINDYDDDNIKVSEAIKEDKEKGIKAKDAVFMTLGYMAIQALNTVNAKEQSMAAEEKVHRATLSVLIHGALKGADDGMVDVDLKDIVIIKDLMNAIYAPLPIMRAFEIFDPKVEDTAGKKSKSS